MDRGDHGWGVLLKILEPLEHSVLDHADPAGHHADPAGQHGDVQDTVKAFGSSNYPGWSTYGGENVPGAVRVYA